MLEGLAAWVLNTYLGEYVENLNTDQLSIGLLSGAVELGDLPLKRDALRNLDLPVEVKTGFIGKIRLQIPVRAIRSEPWVISLDKLYLVAGPSSNKKCDIEEEEVRSLERKKQQLAALEEEWKRRCNSSQSDEGSSYWYAYSTSVIYNILENLQLNVNDIHIRYEDDITVPGQSVACGITIESLSAQTLNGEKEEGMSIKLLGLKNFSVYWDTDAAPLGNLAIHALKDALGKKLFASCSTGEFMSHEYILEPISAEAKLHRNLSPKPLRSRTSPRFLCDADLDRIQVTLTEDQYHGLLTVMKEFERADRAKPFKKWRPTRSVKESPREWWKFSIQCTQKILEDRSSTYTSDDFLKKLKQMGHYYHGYYKQLEGEILSPDEEERIASAERELNFTELRKLREGLYDELEEKRKAMAALSTPGREGLMQRWVWGWGSSAQTSQDSSSPPLSSSPQSPPPIDEDELRDIIGDPEADSTLLKRDHVFALLNFNLEGGSLKLAGQEDLNVTLRRASSDDSRDSLSSHSSVSAHSLPEGHPMSGIDNPNHTIIELEFSTVKMSYESRLRTTSSLFCAKLGGLCVRDMVTKESLFPNLISQQKKEEYSLPRRPQQFGLMAKQQSGSYMEQSPAFKLQRKESEAPLFEMSYESNPPSSNADYRLEITTRPLDMIYNPSAMQRVSSFFSSRTGEGVTGLTSRASELKLTETARLRYEELKNETKQDLINTLDTLLGGEEQNKVKRWDVELDIAAPQIIIPDSFHKRDATLVVLDFGRLQLTSNTATARKEKKSGGSIEPDLDSEDLDDDFCTPLSTPPSEVMLEEEEESTVAGFTEADLGAGLTQEALREKLYDSYTLNLSDLQVLVSKASENWKVALTRNKGAMQVVKKFTISMKVERRLMFTTDPQWPSATVSGNLPSLSIHINEKKILALNHCLQLLADTDQRTEEVSIHKVLPKPERNNTVESEMEETFTAKTQALLEESRLLEMQFCVDKLSVEVQSRNRTIVELQVFGAKANLTKKPFNTCISVTVHGLLLIDALQQFGPEFELLVASHKDLSLHAPSGSLIDSETSTPRSPVSPQSPASPVERQGDVGQQNDFSSRLAQAGRNLSAALWPASLPSSSYASSEPWKTEPASSNSCFATEQEALITANLMLIDPNTPNYGDGGPSKVATIHFNNLDLIANQQTIVELMTFFNNVLPAEPQTTHSTSTESILEKSEDTETFKISGKAIQQMDLIADFNRINIVLMKRTKVNKGQKVATVTISDAHVQASSGDSTWVKGHLGGLQLLDVTPEGTKYQKVFNLGQDHEAAISPLHRPESHDGLDLYHIALQTAESSTGKSLEDDRKACQFHWTEGADSPPSDQSSMALGTPSADRTMSVYRGKNLLDVQLASPCYTHVPRFLDALTECFDEFQSSVSHLAGSIQKVASAAAKDFIKTELTSELSFTWGTAETTMESSNLSAYQLGQDLVDANMTGKKEADWEFEIFMQSPVIIIPRAPQSSELLVGRLGNIQVEKKSPTLHLSSSWDVCSTPLQMRSTSIKQFVVQISDMNLFSFNSEDLRQASVVSNKDKSRTSPQSYVGTEILHNTSIEIILNRMISSEYHSDTSDTDSSEDGRDFSTEPLISGKVLHPFRVVLSKHIYEQVLETVDNLTYRPPHDRTESRMKDAVILEEANDENVDRMSSLRVNVKGRDVKESETNVDLAEIKEAVTALTASFDLPQLEVVLCGDLSEGEQGLVTVSLENFHVDFEKTTPFVTTIKLSLQSLKIEDLLQSKQRVPHKYIVISHDGKGDPLSSLNQPKMVHSTSCPSNMVGLQELSQFKPLSLPSDLNQPHHPQYQLPPTFRPFVKSHGKNGIGHPSTPPPSMDVSVEDLQGTRGDEAAPSMPEALVYIRAVFVDEECPQFETKYRKVNHSVDVDFNALDIIINQQTWLLLLDFLGIGTAVKSPSQEEQTETARAESTQDTEQLVQSGNEKTTEMNIEMASLSLILNKPEYELAKASVSIVTAHVMLKDGNMDVSGKLGKISLLDLTPHGKLYPERFLTKGDQAVSFEFFKYGLPDPDLTKEFDMSVKLRMSSVHYIHTARYQNEVLAFFEQFSQLQDMLGRMRASTAGQMLVEGPYNGARIKLDVQAGSPVLLVPISSRSKELLVINLGNLTLTNEFLPAGQKGTISRVSSKVSPRGEKAAKNGTEDESDKGELLRNIVFPVPQQGLASPLLDDPPAATSVRGRGTIGPDIKGTETPRAKKKESPQSEPAVRAKRIPSADPLDHVCLLDCIHIDLVDMDLFSSHRLDHQDFDPRDGTALIFPSFAVARKGFKLLKEQCRLKLQVERNLASAISRAVPDMSISGGLSSVHCCLEVPQYQLIRGMLEFNLGEPLEEFQNVPKSENPVNQTILSGQVWTQICMKIDLVNVTLEICDAFKGEETQPKSIAQFNFNKSCFSFESFSNDSMTVDLVSHAIRSHDTRNTGANIFREVFTPTKHHSRNPNPLQLELHYSSNAETMKATVLLNNMRVVCVMDLMLAVKDFLLDYDSQKFRSETVCSSRNSEASHSKSSSTLGLGGSRTNRAVPVGTGIITKRVIPEEEFDKILEVRINITETEFVIVENTASHDSGAVILKFTCAVLVYTPNTKENPFTGSLEGLETFSCFMNNEQETALSIIEPATINFQLKGSPSLLNQNTAMSGGLTDVNIDGHTIFEVHSESMNIRVSYHDAQLFLAIMNSLPEQLKQGSLAAWEREVQSAVEQSSPQDVHRQNQLRRLMELGFRIEDCQHALSKSDYHLDQAASWLLSNAEPYKGPSPAIKRDEEKKLEIAGIEIRAASFSICLIDDCGDSDVPLIELSLQNLDFYQKLLPNIEGRSSGVLSADYYNRHMSGWEPFIEPWKCHGQWYHQEHQRRPFPEKLYLEMKAENRLDLNITREMLDLYTNTKNSWTEDYYESRSSDSSIKRRSPFIPFALRNLTGCKLCFSTITSTLNRGTDTPPASGSPSGNPSSPFSAWRDVMPHEVVPFSFEEQGKQRHGHTHEHRSHQLVVRVEGWEQLPAVFVDRVGTFFRKVRPSKSQIDERYQETSTARIVFVVTLEGSARKLITVHSALSIVSGLSVQMELLLTDPANPANKMALPLLEPGGSVPIPLQLINWDIYLRPHDWGTEVCTKPLIWKAVTKPGDTMSFLMECKIGVDFKFCAFVKHEKFPASRSRIIEPGHTVTLLPPIVLTNLLPVDLTFAGAETMGDIKPGKDCPLYQADLNHAVDLNFSLESFPRCSTPLRIPGKFMQDSYARIDMLDDRQRPLQLMARIECRAGRCLKVYISAHYWLVNMSGLPLILKQHWSDEEAAGQCEDHEMARSVEPLMFSYPAEDHQLVTMRLGKVMRAPGTSPMWCNRISLEGGAGVRALRLAQPENKPCRVYHVGIDIRPGRGRYRDTTIVTFVPRFQLENRSRHKLAFTQKCFIQNRGTLIPKEHLTVTANSSVTFHWPRDDLDKLLGVKLADDVDSWWSGGININKPGSVNINLRGLNNCCRIMHVEIRLQGATYFVLFSDADDLPPPYRIDNLSEVNVTFWQTKVEDRRLKMLVRPHSSVSYAFDEPILPNLITCEVEGGSHATYNLNRLELGDNLYYENFIYIAMSQTFESPADSQTPLKSTLFGGQIWSASNLVLDVPSPGSPVVLRKKEPGRRSQLWRMTTTGMLQNEAFTPPRDPHSPSRQNKQCLVLDIKTSGPVYNETSPLILRVPTDSRKSTQTWKFEKDGTLRCLFASFAVQPKYRVLGLKEGAEMVLGPAPTVHNDFAPATAPAEMAIERQKNLPGSGSLSCRVITDGPTRVLQVMDVMQQRVLKRATAIPGSLEGDFEAYVTEVASAPSHNVREDDGQAKKEKLFEMVIGLKKGVGISLISSHMEELAYASCSGMDIHLNHSEKETDLRANIGNVQIDNQMYQAKRPLVLYMNEDDNSDTTKDSKAMSLVLTKQNSVQQALNLFKRCILTVGKLSLHVEELLLMKLLEFAGFAQSDSAIEKMTDTYYDSLRKLATGSQTKRYYFELLKIHPLSFRLSVLTSSNLPNHLVTLRKQLHLILVQFEDAPVSLDAYTSQHQFETQEFFTDAVRKHYTEELQSQAIKILGSVDFLGNPIGLMEDIRDGLKELVLERNVTGLVKNVAHGLSNSGAKVTGSISDQVGALALDEHHQDLRSTIRGDHDGSSSGHFSAGLKGFAFGVIGGLTGVLTQPVQGAASEGVGGFMKGLGKGVVGTFTKPAAGVLDLASGTFNALKSSTDNEPAMPAPVRLRRCCVKAGGGLSRYSSHDARGSDYVLKLFNGSGGERYYALETVRQPNPGQNKQDGLMALVTSEATYFLKFENPKEVVLMVRHSELIHARAMPSPHTGKGASVFHVELTKSTLTGPDRPRVTCDNQRIAKKVSSQINYAKSCFEELKQEVADTGSDLDLTLVLSDYSTKT